MSNIIHPDLVPMPETESHEPPVSSEEAKGNPAHLKCPKCGDTPLHYELHVKVCKGTRKG